MTAKDKCIIEDCPHMQVGRGWCTKHWCRWRRTGDPMKVRKRGAVRAAVVPYNELHTRLRLDRGPARMQSCRYCAATAGQWAYDHSDPNAICDVKNRYYSMDLSHYIPLCGPCHVRLDRRLLPVVKQAA